MKILFIGTGAADWVLKERKGDEFFRRLTAVRVNKDLMIDCSADTTDFVDKKEGELDEVENVLITHTHSDHYSPETILNILGDDVRVWAEKEAEEMILSDMPQLRESVLEIFEENTVGKYTVIPVPASHSVANRKQTPVNYIISDGEKTIFWGCDSAWIPNYSWHEMKNHKFDLIVLDGTLGDADGDYRIFEHNNIAMIKEMTNTIKSQQLLKENGKVMISHMSRYAHKEHSELQKQLDDVGVIVAYDDMEIEI